MLICWHTVITLLLVSALQSRKEFLLEALFVLYNFLDEELLFYVMAVNKEEMRTTGNNRRWTDKMILIHGTYPIYKKNFSSENTSYRIQPSREMVSSLVNVESHKKLVRNVLEEFEFVNFNSKLNIKRGVEQKFKEQAIRHCSDLNSYYFPALNECYRIFRTPFNNLDANYGGDRNELAYGTSQYDYMYNCWELYHGKLLDVGAIAMKEKMDLVKQMVIQFYEITEQQDTVRVGFMVSKNYELMAQNGTFYDVLDGVSVKMHPTEPCDSICCVIIYLTDETIMEMVQASCNAADVPNFFCQREGNI